MGTFDSPGRLVGDVSTVTGVLLGEPEEGLDGLLVWDSVSDEGSAMTGSVSYSPGVPGPQQPSSSGAR